MWNMHTVLQCIHPHTKNCVFQKNSVLWGVIWLNRIVSTFGLSERCPLTVPRVGSVLGHLETRNTHDEYGVLVMHDDDDGRCPDARQ